MREGSGSDVGLEALAVQLRVLGSAKRLRILKFLSQPHHAEEIASELGVARQTAQEHVQSLVELGLLEPMRARGEHGPVMTFVVVPQRLFSIYEQFGTLGDLERDLEERVDVRAATMPEPAGPAAPREQTLPRLTIVHGMRVGQTTVLSGAGPWLVGRDAGATVSLDYDPYASGRHAEVRRVLGGGFRLADLHSSNGTFVDWKRMPAGDAVPLENGALVRVGKTILHFRHVPPKP